MEIARSFKVRYLINILLIVWLSIWGYFMALNWEVFTVKLNIYLGFTLINGRPFVLLFILSTLVIVVIRYLLQYSRMLRRLEVKEKNTKITMQEKDIEILKLKELLYKEHRDEFNKTANNITALHNRIESVAKYLEQKKDEEKKIDNNSDLK